jgi:hypothetical protein
MPAVAETMGDILALPPLGDQDDFFLYGGDSLRAVELISKLVERFGASHRDRPAELGSALVVGLFDNATPEALALIIDQHLSRRLGPSQPARAGKHPEDSHDD